MLLNDSASLKTCAGAAGTDARAFLPFVLRQLPRSKYRLLSDLRREPSFGRPLEAVTKLALASPNDVLRPLLAQASQTCRELPLLAQDDPSFSAAHQALLFLLELIQHLLPTPPLSAGDNPSPSLEIDGRIADQLMAIAGSQLGRAPVVASEPRHSEDSSSFRDISSSARGLPRRGGRHDYFVSRSTTLSPSLSTLSFGESELQRGSRHPEVPSIYAGAASRTATAHGFSAIHVDVHSALIEAASAIIYAVSYIRWEAFFGTLRSRLQLLASETSIATKPSAADLAEFRTLGACFIDRVRLTQITQEVSSVFLHIPRIAQAALAEALSQNIWAFVGYAPDDFVAMHQGAVLQADLSSLFDMAWNSCRDLGVMAPRWAASFWPVMTLWIALSPGLCRRIVDRESESRGLAKGAAGKKVRNLSSRLRELSKTDALTCQLARWNLCARDQVAWFDSLQSSFYLPNFAGVAKRCCIDLVYFSTLLPTGDDFSLKLLVSDFVVELQEQLLYGEDDHRVSMLPSRVLRITYDGLL